MAKRPAPLPPTELNTALHELYRAANECPDSDLTEISEILVREAGRNDEKAIRVARRLTAQMRAHEKAGK